MFLNSVRLTSPHQNTQKSLAAPSANTEIYKIQCHWWSMKQYEKNNFLSKFEQLIVAME